VASKRRDQKRVAGGGVRGRKREGVSGRRGREGKKPGEEGVVSGWGRRERGGRRRVGGGEEEAEGDEVRKGEKGGGR